MRRFSDGPHRAPPCPHHRAHAGWLVALILSSPLALAATGQQACQTTELQRLLAEADATAVYARLREVIAHKLPRQPTAHLAPDAAAGLAEPLQVAQMSRALSAWPDTATDAAAVVDAFTTQVAARFGYTLPPAGPRRVPDREVEPVRLREYSEQVLNMAHAQVSRAFAKITGPELSELRTRIPALLDSLVEHNTLADRSGPLTDGVVLLKGAAAKAQNGALLSALASLAGLTTPAARQAFGSLTGTAAPRPAWLDSRFEGDFIAAWRSEHGLILIGGPGPNRYGAPAAIIVEVGGDDVYAPDAPAPVSLIIDLDGNDEYLGTAGVAVLGVALLVDVAGNDRYAGARPAHGAAVLGSSVVADLGGDDRYEAGELAQGAALFGSALLYDAAGDDDYRAAKFAQAWAGAGGFARLVDRNGDDRYHLGGRHASTYREPDRYQAYGQGMGMGLAHFAAGGIGVLLDAAGDDKYHADNFAQGVGYYMGVGILADTHGDDRYHGGRYSQGAAAHLGIGVLLDDAGADRYIGEQAANQGAAWDLAVAVLCDAAGDDQYQGAELSLGAAEQNGIGMFVDAQGRDRYAAPDKAFGFGGDHSYDGGRGARNLGVFVDGGGGADDYDSPAASNDVLRTRGQLGVFADR